MKMLKIGEVVYYTRREPYGYGYQIMSKTPIDEKRNKYDELFLSYDKEKVKEIFDKIEKTKEVPTTFPDTSNEVPPTRVLVHRTKHYTYHYNVSTKEMLIKTFRHILNEEKDYYYKPDEPKNDTGITCVEDLEKIPFDEMREQTAEKWEKYEKQLKSYKNEFFDWNILQEVINGKGNLRDVRDTMDVYEEGKWEIEDLIEV